MVEGVADHSIPWSQQRLKQARVGVKAGGVEDGVGAAMEGGDPLLQLLVDVL
jgi:hypothetical protein